jgi:hypothetical protein
LSPGQGDRSGAQAVNEQVIGTPLSGSEAKAQLEGKTVGEVRAQAPDFSKPAEDTSKR